MIVDRSPFHEPTASQMANEGFDLLERVGSGGNGDVWSGTNVATGAPVAVKILKAFDDASKTDRRAARFYREIATMQDLTAKDINGVMPIFDFGVLTGGRPWYSMPLAKPLEPVSADRIRWSVEAGIALSRIVDEMWERGGATHRDIKPSNVLVLEGTIVLADFGLALRNDDTNLTVTGEVPGSLLYQAPEAARLGHKPNPPGDVFSIGKTIWALSTGRPPDAHGPLTERDALEGIDGCPTGLDEILQMATADARTPQDAARPTAANLADALEATLAAPPEAKGQRPNAVKVALGLFGGQSEVSKAAKAADAASSQLMQAAGNAFKASWKRVAAELGWPEIRGGGGSVPNVKWTDNGFEASGRYYQDLDVEGASITVSLAFFRNPELASGNIRLGTSLFVSERVPNGQHLEVASRETNSFHMGPGYEAEMERIAEFFGSDEQVVRVVQEIRKLVDQQQAK